MKKLASILISGVLALSACVIPSASAAYYDNNGNVHSNAYYKGKVYSNAHSHFKNNYGWGEGSEYFNLYKNGVHSGNLICMYNPQAIGTEKATAWVGRANNQTGFYLDSYMIYNGSKTKESNTRYIDGIFKSTNCYAWVNNSSRITYFGTLYW